MRSQTRRAGLEPLEADLLGELAAEGLLLALARLDPAAGRRPPDVVGDRVLEAEEKHAVVGVDDERAHRRARDRLEPVVERAEPVEALGVRDGGVRGRGRGQDVESGRAERPHLRPELGALAEGAAVGLLADERDRARPKLLGDLREPRPVEVAAPKVARAGRRAVGGVRDAVAERQQIELLGRVVEPRREPAVVEQAPEVVARVREVRVRGVGEAPGVDPAEDAPEAGREDVWDGWS